MKILVELPTWLGDAVMATPALKNLYDTYPDAEITLLGSYVSTEALKADRRVSRVLIDVSRKGGFRALNIYRLAKEAKEHDLAVSFRGSFYSKMLLFLTGSKTKAAFDKKKIETKAKETLHQVEKYQAFINEVTKRDDLPGPLRLYHPKRSFDRPTMGINPGATYGSAKRWYPEKFAEVAAELSKKFDIIIFGGPAETDIAADIESALSKMGVKNVTNMAGKTTIPQLCGLIGGLDLFITGDSGPMHIAAAYGVPTVAIFGPTKFKETSQWMNEKSVIVRKELECAPCMKRTCPLKTHECMKSIEADEVIEAAEKLLD